MQWTKKSAHLVLQMRTQVLDERLEDTLRDWRPKKIARPISWSFSTTTPAQQIDRGTQLEQRII